MGGGGDVGIPLPVATLADMSSERSPVGPGDRRCPESNDLSRGSDGGRGARVQLFGRVAGVGRGKEAVPSDVRAHGLDGAGASGPQGALAVLVGVGGLEGAGMDVEGVSHFIDPYIRIFTDS